MAENKKQHYIPQFYLRNFSKDSKQIFIFHLASRTFILSPIASTCQEKYFYGTDPDFEKMLSALEEKQASIIRKIIDSQNLDSLTSDEKYHLKAFLVLQYGRTKDARVLSEKYFDLFTSHYLKPLMKADKELSKKYSPEYIDSLKISSPNLYKFTLGTALCSIDALSDLTLRLIINKTSKPFISCDSPVVKNNYYTIGKISLTGFLSPGLQIFCPLNDKLSLLFIHREAYEIHNENKMIIELSNDSDIDEINKLQFFNSLDILLFADNGDIQYVKSLFFKCAAKKTAKNCVAETVQQTKTSDGRINEIITQYVEGINHYLHFSFIAKKHEYSRWFRLSFKATLKKSPIVMPYRNEKLAKKMRYDFDALIENARKVAKKKSK